MKTKNIFIVSLCAIVIAFSSCSTVQNMNNKTKGGIIGGAGGAALGALIGNMAGNTGIGAAVGTVVGAGAGVLIGNKMDKAKKEVQAAVPEAKVEEVTDDNGLQANKVTFDSKILFATNKADLSNAAKQNLVNFAGVLKKYNDVNLTIYGHTDSTGSDKINDPLSQQRAEAVSSFLKTCGVSDSVLTSVVGKGSRQPVASNATADGRSLNRRVEVYMYASEQMIEAAQNGSLK